MDLCLVEAGAELTTMNDTRDHLVRLGQTCSQHTVSQWWPGDTGLAQIGLTADCRLSVCQTVRQLSCQTVRPSDCQTVRLSGYQTLILAASRLSVTGCLETQACYNLD